MNNRGHWEVDFRVTNTPQDLWRNAVEYFKWCDMNPIRPKRTLQAGKESGKKVELELIRPYSIKAMCLHCGITEDYLKDMRNADKTSEAYLIVSRILMNIYVQNQEMAMVGEFNPVFTAKVLNMDSEDSGPQKVMIEYVGDLPQLANSENEILEKLNFKNGEVIILDSKNPKDKSGEI